jgi:uncharacterized Zn-binding protein involved in type VI secretion
MSLVAISGSVCTATRSPVGPCVGIAYGRAQATQFTVFADGIPIVRANDPIFYSGLVFPYWGGIAFYSWVGKVLISGSNVLVEGTVAADLGTLTDSGGTIISSSNCVFV